jgi:hypothetical protein
LWLFYLVRAEVRYADSIGRTKDKAKAVPNFALCSRQISGFRHKSPLATRSGNSCEPNRGLGTVTDRRRGSRGTDPETILRFCRGGPQFLAKEWSEWQDLNLRPPRPERGDFGKKPNLFSGCVFITLYKSWPFSGTSSGLFREGSVCSSSGFRPCSDQKESRPEAAC